MTRAAAAATLAESIIAHSDDAIMARNLEGAVLAWNQSAERMFGYRREEMIGERLTRLFPANRMHEEGELVARLIKGEDISHFDTQRLRKDGTLIDLSITLSAIRNGRGRIVAISAIARNVTAWKSLQAELRQATADLQTILDHSPVMISHWNGDLSNRFANRAYAAAMGLSVDELRGRHAREVMGAQLYEQSSPFIEAARRGQTQSFERETRLGDGSTRHHQVEYVPNASGAAVTGVFMFASDVTERRASEQALKISEAYLDRAGRMAGVGAWAFDLQTRLVYWSDQTCRMHDMPVGHLPGLEEAVSYYHGDARKQIESAVQECIASGRPYELELPMVTASGRNIWVRAAGELETVNGKAARLFGVFQDITVRKMAELALIDSERKYRSLFELAPIGIALNDLESGQFLHVNDALANPTGYTRDELLTMSYWDLTPEQFDEQELAQLEALRHTERYGPYEEEYRRKDGSTYAVLLSGIRTTGPGGRPLIWSMVQDISQRKAMEFRLTEAAQRDKLTGLANRALFMDRLEKSIARVTGGEQPFFAVLFFDFDRFKLVNDTLGHEAGDELLRQIARRLRSELRASDTVSEQAGSNVVSRFGGDEFLVLINDLKFPGDATRIAERLLNALTPVYSILGSEVHSSASIGIVTSAQCQTTAEEVVRNADVAMYEAKRAGRGCSVVFDEAMHTRLTRHVTVESSLRKAIGTEEFHLVYQPIVELQSGEMVSAEALIRWNHPLLGPISPSEFIPIAEESGLIVALGQWVQKEACQALATWRARDPLRAPATVSVNISRAELALGSRLLEQLRDTLDRTGLPPHCLQLEVTEREVMRNPDASLALMKSLQTLGVKLAMDDFGTGTSSLGFLRSYPFNTIKIDRSFVQDLTSSADVLAVIHATINLVENLGMASLAEGVEDQAQIAILQSLGCRYAQGYLFSRPVPPGKLLDALADARAAAAASARSSAALPAMP